MVLLNLYTRVIKASHSYLNVQSEQWRNPAPSLPCSVEKLQIHFMAVWEASKLKPPILSLQSSWILFTGGSGGGGRTNKKKIPHSTNTIQEATSRISSIPLHTSVHALHFFHCKGPLMSTKEPAEFPFQFIESTLQYGCRTH